MEKDIAIIEYLQSFIKKKVDTDDIEPLSVYIVSIGYRKFMVPVSPLPNDLCLIPCEIIPIGQKTNQTMYDEEE